MITPELNAAVTELLLRIKGFQDRAMARNAMKVGTSLWEVRVRGQGSAALSMSLNHSAHAMPMPTPYLPRPLRAAGSCGLREVVQGR